MLNFIAQNIGTIVVLLVLSAAVALVIYKMISDKKKGKSSCGCNCGCCPNSQLCHKNSEETPS